MSFMSADFPTIPEDGGAFFNNPEWRNLAISRLSAPPEEAFMHRRIIEVFNLGWYARLRSQNTIRACALAHMVVGQDPRAQKLLAGTSRTKPDDANRYLMEAMLRMYNFPTAFSEIFYRAFDATYGKKAAALAIIQPIACGTNLHAVAAGFTRLHGANVNRNSYKALAEIIVRHKPALLADLKAPALKVRLNLV